jgi:hypothetical protein
MNSSLLFYLLFITFINNFFLLPFVLIGSLFTKKIITLYTNINYICISGLLKYYYNISVYIENIKIAYELCNAPESIKLVYQQDSKQIENDTSIIILNHLTQFDFVTLTLFSSFSKNILFPNTRGIIYYFAYIYLPGIGILSYLNKGVMISFNKIKNFLNLEKCKINKNDLIYLYPEGNVYCTKMKNSVDKYCDDNNIERMKNCLYPRSGALDILHKNNNIKNIYSVCMQYDNIKPCGKYHTLSNTKLPNKVYFKFNKHELNGENINKKTVDIFREFDNELDKNIDESKYLLIGKSYIELFCMIFFALLFITACYYIINYNYVLLYYVIATILYYVYTFIVIYTK